METIILSLISVAVLLISLYTCKKIKVLIIESPSYFQTYVYSFLFAIRILAILVIIGIVFSFVLSDVVDVIISFTYPLTIFAGAPLGILSLTYPLVSYIAIIIYSLLLAVIPSISTYIIAKGSKSMKKIILWQYIGFIISLIIIYFGIAIQIIQ